MAKRIPKRPKIIVLAPDVTLEEFIAGETLTYTGFDGQPTQMTYRTGVGIYVERDGVDLGLAAIVTDVEARRAYGNLTRCAQEKEAA